MSHIDDVRLIKRVSSPKTGQSGYTNSFLMGQKSGTNPGFVGLEGFLNIGDSQMKIIENYQHKSHCECGSLE